jgi:beta-lactamase class A
MLAHTKKRRKAPSPVDELQTKLTELERSTGAIALGVAVHDEETGFTFQYNADRWFHAASTIKLAILIGVYSAVHKGHLHPEARLHVRNRFHSALDGLPFRVRADRDANAAVQAQIGKTMRVHELSRHMIVTSSNLAANLLLDLVGLGEIHNALDELQVVGVDVRRGVEDERAWAAGMNNRVTANGLVRLLRTVAEERAFTPELSRQMLGILHSQEFKSGIPARLPREVKVAHKTGEISTIAHDAGIVFVPRRKPYVLSVLTEWPSNGHSGRSATIASISHEVYSLLMRRLNHA